METSEVEAEKGRDGTGRGGDERVEEFGNRTEFGN